MTLLFDYIFGLGRPEGHAELGVVTSWLLGTQKLRSKVATKLPQELKLHGVLVWGGAQCSPPIFPNFGASGEAVRPEKWVKASGARAQTQSAHPIR